MLYSLILVLSVLAGVFLGFYFGYLKRENKPPDIIPFKEEISGLKEFISEKMTKQRDTDNDSESWFS